MTPVDPFAPHPLFSVPLHSTILADYEQHRAAMVAEILALKEKYPGVVRSNRQAWHSGPEFLQHKSEHVHWMLQRAMKYAHLALGKYYQNWAQVELKLSSAWANVLGPAGWNAPHHHHPNNWSGVFYVQASNLGITPDSPDGKIEFLNPTPMVAGQGAGGNFLYGPKDGLVLLFPSSIYHFVHPHFTDEQRISIAFNLLLAPKT